MNKDREPELAEHKTNAWSAPGNNDDPVVQEAVSSWRKSLARGLERDETFWIQQRLAIHRRLASSDGIGLRHWATAAVAALMLLGVLLLSPTPFERHTRSSPPSPSVQPSDAEDNALLQGVEDDVARDTPVALQPATLIADESSLLSFSATDPNRNGTTFNKEQNP